MSARARLFALEQFGIKLGLDQITGLVNALGRPDRAFASIVVAGTNGKGSITAMIERGLRAAGWRTGRYISPHLVDLEERFVVDGRTLPADEVDHASARVLAAGERLPAPPTFFEATTAMALDLFRAREVDISVLEVGLGGRLDATNVVTPVAAAISAVDFDHEQHLGHTLEAIAREKAGIVKAGATVVLSENPPAVVGVVREACETRGARLVFSPEGCQVTARMVNGRTILDLVTPRARYDQVPLALRGRHQVQNALTAVRLLEELPAPFRLPADAIRTALTDVAWPARLELVHRGTTDLLIDGAHNPAGARALAAYISEAYGGRLPMVVGLMRDKRIEAVIAALAPAASHFVFTAIHSDRAAAPAALAAAAAAAAPAVPCSTMSPPRAAVTAAAALGPLVVIAGSLYLAGEIRAGQA